MDRDLQNYLLPNEQPLWEGKPQQFPVMDVFTKKRLILRWILTVLLSAAVIAAYCKNNDTLSIPFFVLFAVLDAIICFSPLLERRNVLGQTYWITNRRAIVRLRSKEFFDLDLSALDEVQLLQGVAEYDCLALGSALFPAVLKQARWQACHPKAPENTSDAHGHSVGLLFYCPNRCEEAFQLLQERKGGAAQEKRAG